MKKRQTVATPIAAATITGAVLLAYLLNYDQLKIGQFKREAARVSSTAGVTVSVTLYEQPRRDCDPVALATLRSQIHKIKIENGEVELETTPSITIMKGSDVIGYYYSPGFITFNSVGHETVGHIHDTDFGRYLQALNSAQ